MEELYKRYVTEKLDEQDMLAGLEFDVPEDFNFAYDVVDYFGKTVPSKRALVWVSRTFEEKIFTFGDISRLSSMAANYLKGLGVKRGDRVMLVLRRQAEFWISAVALHKLGAVVVPATDQLMKKDYVYRFKAAGITAVIATSFGSAAAEIEKAEEECGPLNIKILASGSRAGWLDFESVYACSDVFERPADTTKKGDMMLMYFTSGTTGYPKIVLHDYTYPIAHFATAKWWHNVDPEGVHLTVADTGWAKAVWGKIYGQWLMSAAVFAYDYDRFNQNELLSLLEKYRITTFCAPPTIYRYLIKEDISAFDLSGLKYATVAGEALNPEVYNKFLAATGVRLMEGFGQTETTVSIANFTGATPKPGSMGKPNPQYDIRLLDAEGREAQTGDIGEICIYTGDDKPCGMFMGYYKDERQTDYVWHDGYYHTGDLAWRDEDGYYWYYGRADDLIKSSGYRIGPFEIESVIMELPYVMECAVTGVPDPVRGQVVKATVVLRKGTEKSDALAVEIQEYVKHATAPYKYPRIVEFVDALPKTISGKIRRVEIREHS